MKESLRTVKYFRGDYLEGLKNTTKTLTRVADLRTGFWNRELPLTGLWHPLWQPIAWHSHY